VKLSDFDYELPPGRIAQRPLSRRDDSRLLVMDRASGASAHRRFEDLPELLDPGDLLVLNDTRVLAARLHGAKPSGGRVEALLLERVGGADSAPEWRCLLRASRTPGPGGRVEFGRELSAEVLARGQEHWTLRFESPDGNPAAAIERVGRLPLPPYIEREAGGDSLDEEDRERYQTVYAKRPGAVAAPTAGLHFSPRLLRRLADRGVQTTLVTLHVGPGTFQPVRVEVVEEHRMHDESYALPESAADAIARTRREGGRVVAVGTTVVRTLEHRARADGTVEPGAGRCGLFIYPGFEFRVVDALITNFHLPRSTLLMLVSAFAGREAVLDAYAEAIREGYRFYSYGDAMMVRSG
jgi:S-adenosylmethionine:tRNA ribosyltransferase-isomerase